MSEVLSQTLFGACFSVCMQSIKLTFQQVGALGQMIGLSGGFFKLPIATMACKTMGALIAHGVQVAAFPWLQLEIREAWRYSLGWGRFLPWLDQDSSEICNNLAKSYLLRISLNLYIRCSFHSLFHLIGRIPMERHEFQGRLLWSSYHSSIGNVLGREARTERVELKYGQMDESWWLIPNRIRMYLVLRNEITSKTHRSGFWPGDHSTHEIIQEVAGI